MFFVITIIIGIVSGIVIYVKDASARAADCVVGGILICLLSAVMILTPSAMAQEKMETYTVETTYVELIPLNHIYPQEYSENDYILFKEGKYCFYIKNKEGIIDYKQISGINEIRFNEDEPIAYVTEKRDFKNPLADILYPKTFCDDFYYLNLPKGSEITYVIVEGGK